VNNIGRLASDVSTVQTVKLDLGPEIDVPDRRKKHVLQRARPHEKVPLKVALQKT